MVILSFLGQAKQRGGSLQMFWQQWQPAIAVLFTREVTLAFAQLVTHEGSMSAMKAPVSQ
eukprot:10008337-Lingulodinium_polyedra.AAC.1